MTGVLPPFTSDTSINPAESGFYYLNSRYYDPEICRFINADGLIPLGDIIYCVTAVGLMAVARIGGKYARVSHQVAKAHAEIKSKVKKSSKTRYWTAT